jgi:hypothetical protein
LSILRIEKLIIMSNTDAVKQLFEDDPWLNPFEPEIRRRYGKFDLQNGQGREKIKDNNNSFKIESREKITFTYFFI